MDIRDLCNNPECSNIEYKSEWYWDLKEIKNEGNDKSKLWGEFIKDILALINSNIKGFDQTRYMVIGYNETTKEFSDFKLTETLFNSLRSKINLKLDIFISDFENIDYNMTYHSIDGINIIVFKIEQPIKIHCLRKNIQTKNSDYKENTVLYRGNDSNRTNSNDNVGVMHTVHIRKMEDKIHKKYGSRFIPMQTRRNKTIIKTILSYLEKNRTFKLSEGFPKKSKDSKGYF